jgi:hypothetical protein
MKKARIGPEMTEQNPIFSLKSGLILQGRFGRRTLRRLRIKMKYRRSSLDGVPVFFANSFPKSGTHLLTQILEGFPLIGPAVNSGMPAIVVYEGFSGRERTEAEILRDLSRFKPGDTGFGHLHALPGVMNLFDSNAFCPYLMLRDPRDIVVSHVHYVTDMEPNHVHHAYYTEKLHTFDERLRTSILGLPDSPVKFLNIAQRFEPYLPWLDDPHVLCLKYEDCLTNRDEMLGKILDHAVSAGFPLACSREEAIIRLNCVINPSKSPTFRQGKAGGWRKSFSPENTALFKEVAGDMLIRLGYEKDLDW